MIPDFRPYSATTDSSLPWLGQFPAHWKLVRGKNLFKPIDKRSHTGDEELLTVSSERGIVPRRSAAVTMFKAESYVGHKLCWPGDLVINSLWAWARGLGVSRHHGIVSSAYGVYRVRREFELDPWFVNELVRSAPFHWELQVRSKGVWTSRLQLTDESFLDAPFPVPPRSEQSAIVRFLDHVDRKIKRYIRAKKLLIALLNEQKQAIIHHAVTRGLDPNVKLKPSGVEWLGEVPEHWVVRRLGQITVDGPRNGISPPVTEREGALKSFSIAAIRSGLVDVRTDDLKFVEVPPLAGKTYALRREDILLVRGNGNIRLVGKAGRVNVDMPGMVYPDILVRLRLDTGNCAAFVVCFLNSPRGREQFELAARTTVGTFKINNTDVRQVVVPVPPVDEARTIVNKIQSLTRRLDDAVDIAERGLRFVQEYRTRLIADVVTGKLDVRDAASALPDELNESDVVDEPDEAESMDELDEAGVGSAAVDDE